MDEDPDDRISAEMAREGATSDLVKPGLRLAQRYRVDDPIARGGMSIVYRGHDELLDRDVAIKVLGAMAANATGSRQEFLREARAAAALSHPNIVGVYDAGVQGSERYIVMEYVAGGSLWDVIQAEAPMSPRRAIQIAIQVADALDYGHRHGIIHCDVKPQNVLFDESGRPKLVDFGISRSIAATGALTDTISGTAGYIAPEQLLGEPIDGRVDVYSLGCVVYEMLSGDLPFEASNLAALATQRLVRPPVPLSQRNPDIPSPLVGSVMRAIEREPDQRYASAREFAQALSASRTATAATQAPPRPRAPTVSVGRRPAADPIVSRPPRLYPPPATGPRLFWPLTLVLLGVLILLGVLVALRLPGLLGSSGATTPVPKVTEQLLAPAATALHNDGFQINVTLQPTTGSAMCGGHVLGQDPAPGTPLRRGGSVTIVVSRNDQC